MFSRRRRKKPRRRASPSPGVAAAAAGTGPSVRKSSVQSRATARQDRAVIISGVTAFVLTLAGAALAVGLELLEAMAIVLAVASTRRPRDAVIGAAGARGPLGAAGGGGGGLGVGGPAPPPPPGGVWGGPPVFGG